MIMSQKLLTHIYSMFVLHLRCSRFVHISFLACRYGYLGGCRAETEVFSRDALTTQFETSARTQTSGISQDMT
jgi:hypothetical protein